MSNKYYELEINGGVRGSSVGLVLVETGVGEDPDNPAPVPPIEPPLPEEYDPPVVEDVNQQEAAYIPFVTSTSDGEAQVSAAAIDST
ncbi:MAG: hypothetical protein AAF702_42775 [Chloroflexota bacterium]